MLKKINIEYNTYLELEKIGIGAFDPLKHFMTKADFISVVEKMRLPDGSISIANFITSKNDLIVLFSS